ncbi:MAG: enolase C-terminal domain-like protein [Candidatus Dormibacteraceae bacterium]
MTDQLHHQSLLGQRITEVQSLTFRYQNHTGRDSEGHRHPAPAHDAEQRLLRIRTGDGLQGHAFGGSQRMVEAVRRQLLSQDPFQREAITALLQKAGRLDRESLSDKNLGIVDQALWDLAGQATGLPVYKLLGGSRDRVPAYASTMVGDDIPGGLDSPESYAAFAKACVAQGYRAVKMHTWMPPYGPDLGRDIAACTAVREAVGPDIKLMLDPFHNYTREEALQLGRAIEELDFHWMEEPMDEYSVSSYVWLCENLELPICGPESAAGALQTRAEWIVREAADIVRTGLEHGGITHIMKTAHLCEAFGLRLELHGGGAGSLQALAAMPIPGEYFEYGLLHPHLDFEGESPWLRTPIDRIDADGQIPLPRLPGLGLDIDWDFIHANVIEDWQ